MSTLTPMMKQWKNLKTEAKDALLFFRLGDFYEAFLEDAVVISKELNITLTKRQNILMCGVPYHAAEGYIDKLILKGYKVAIAEQTEDARLAKGLVKRAIVKTLSPGTIINSNLLKDKSNNFFISIAQVGLTYGLSILDLSTSEFSVLELENEKDLMDEILKLKPKEILVSQKFKKTKDQLLNTLSLNIKYLLTEKDDWYFDFDMAYSKLLSHFNLQTLDGFGLKAMSAAINSAGALVSYLTDDLTINLDHITKIKAENLSTYMSIDFSTMRNLEVLESNNHLNKENTLLNLLDKTSTAMGGRLIQRWLKLPLLDIDKIVKRQDAIEEVFDNFDIFLDVKENLDKIRDLERLIMRLINNSANPRDLATLRFSLSYVPKIKELLKDFKSDLIVENTNNLKDVFVLLDLLNSSLVESPPFRIIDENIFQDEYNKDLDELRLINRNAASWINNYQKELREKTNIKNLKVGFTKVFGYYIEVNRSKSEKVLDNFIRKQTLVNNERYITEELKEFENKIFTSEEKIKKLEAKLYEELREKILKYSKDIETISKAISKIDVLFSLARAAKAYNFKRPLIDNSNIIDIKKGRHPIIESSSATGEFIPNDTYLDIDKNQLFLITGPNMAGKSTYIRQVAVISLMAQIGSFIPAEKARIGIVDKIFSRIGASDDLSKGQSTFMVEMAETANILNNATEKSLIILDEIGRGTSTYDGISIAWAVAEFLLTKKAKTLFATHYFELTDLEKEFDGAINYNIAVKENDDGIVFLRKIIKGSADKSYGVHVAKLAGLPFSVIKRAKERLLLLENPKKPLKEKKKTKKEDQFFLFNVEDKIDQKMKNLLDEIKKIDIDKLTPIEALQKIYNFKKRINS